VYKNILLDEASFSSLNTKGYLERTDDFQMSEMESVKTFFNNSYKIQFANKILHLNRSAVEFKQSQFPNMFQISFSVVLLTT
jgi:hypothetical protein